MSCRFIFPHVGAPSHHIVRLQPRLSVWPSVKPPQSCLCRRWGSELLDQVHLVPEAGPVLGASWVPWLSVVFKSPRVEMGALPQADREQSQCQ